MKTNNHELMTRICDSEPPDPYLDNSVILNYDWLYRQVEELCVPISKIEALIKELKSQPFADVRYLEVKKIQNLIDKEKQ